MSIHNLNFLFKPKSVALIGASNKPSSVGSILAKNLLHNGFDGPVMLVNPKHHLVEGIKTYSDITSLPITPDLAIIASPPDTVPGIIDELGAHGTKAAVVITAGFAETTKGHGNALQKALLDIAKAHRLRIVGPNCLGILVPCIGLNASFAHVSAATGQLAFVTQSGAIVTSILDWAHARNVGFSHLVSLGDMADVDFGDMLDYLVRDPDTRAILLYIEAVTHTRKFISAARAATRMKPVIVVKAGRYAEGARAAASHTGALVGSDAIYDAVFRRAGMLRVFSLEELFDATETLATSCNPKGDQLAILTNGGGIGVLATDSVIAENAHIANLSKKTLAELNKVLPSTWSHGNPIDIVGDAPGERYTKTLEILLKDQGVDAILILNCPTAVTSSTEAARAVIDTLANNKCSHVLTSWVGNGSAAEGRRLFAEHDIPSYNTPEQAVRAFMYQVNYLRNQKMLLETPPSISEEFSPDLARARFSIEGALEQGRSWLSEPEAKEILSAYDVPVVTTYFATTPEEATALAAQIGGPVALKIVSPDITHKTDMGGVSLDLVGPKAVQQAAYIMSERLAKTHPKALLQGFSVQQMVRRPDAYELIIGVAEDAQFGPVILFGQGGTAVEIIKDQALALPPLNMRLAHEVMSRTRIFKLLQGYRGQPAVNLNTISLTLIKITQLIIDIPEITELDINPLLADTHGVIALDARIKITTAAGRGIERLSIRPYPRELEEVIQVGSGRTLLLRPIMPEDESSLQAGFTKLTPEEVRLRFFTPMKTLSHVNAARLTQIDYDREMALILTDPGIPGTTEIYGVVRIITDPNNERAEYAIIVRHNMTGLGLGTHLMRRIIDYARSRCIGEIYGDVLRENKTMLKLCKVLGFTKSNVSEDRNMVRVSLKL